MFASVNVEHEAGERTLQSSTSAIQNCKTGCGDLRGALEIENAKLSPNVHMVFWFKLKLRLSTPATNLDVVGFFFADRHALVRDVRQGRQKVMHARLGLSAQVIQLCDSIFKAANFSTSSFRLFLLALLHQVADFATGSIALCV